MINKKTIAILITAITISGLSAKFCRDKETGERVSCTGKIARGTGNFFANAVTLGGYGRSKAEQAKKEAAMKEREEEENYEEETGMISSLPIKR